MQEGLQLEKQLAEKSLFVFMEKIFLVDVERWDDEYHWNMTQEEQNVRWCHNCKFFERMSDEDDVILSLADPFKYHCMVHKRRAKPFAHCTEYVSPNGVTGYDPAIRKMQLYPRESLKTTIGVVGYILWCWIQDLDYTFLVLSQGEKHAKKVMHIVKKQIATNKKIRQYWPELCEAYENATIADAYVLHLDRPDINKIDASLTVASIDAGLEGGHVDEILYDDVIGSKHARSVTMMDTAKATYLTTLPLRIESFPKQRYFATIQDDNDLTSELIAGGQWDVEQWEMCYIRMVRGKEGVNPAIIHKGMKYRQVMLEDCQRWMENKFIDDDLYIPYSKWFSPDKILEKIKEFWTDPNYLFTQYFNRPYGNPNIGFHKGWFTNMTEKEIIQKYYKIIEEKEEVPWDLFNTYCCVDLATGKKDAANKNSDNAYIVLSVDPNNNIFKRYNWIGKEDVVSAVERILMLKEKYPEIEFFTMESGQALEFFMPYFDIQVEKKTLEHEINNSVYDDPRIAPIARKNISKKARIVNAWQPLYKTGKVVHVGSYHNWAAYVSQFLSISRKKEKDDRGLDGVDASSDLILVKTLPDPTMFYADLAELVHRDPDIDAFNKIARKSMERMVISAEEINDQEVINQHRDIWS